MKRSLFCLVFLTALLGIFSSLWAATIYVPTEYSTIQAAIDAASPGDVIQIAAGTYLITSQINVDSNISIEGQGTVTIKANNPNWTTDNSGKHLIGIYGGTDISPVTISNITMDCNGQSYGLNAYNNAFGNLSYVTINNSKGAGLIVNGSTIMATNLNTSGNTWGAVNVDPGSGVTYPSVFTLVSGDLGENNQIWSDGAHVTAQATVTVTTPVGYSKYYVGDTTVCYWTNRDLENCATITRNNETRVYQTIQAAINAATAGDEINVAAGTYNEAITINKGISLLGAGAANTIIDCPVTSSSAVRITAAGNVKFDGFKVFNSIMATSNHYQISVSGGSVLSEVEISHNTILGSGIPEEAHDDYAFTTQGTLSNVIFKYNTVSNCASNVMLLERHLGSSEISYNNITTQTYPAIYYMTYKNPADNNPSVYEVTTKQWVHHNAINAGGASGVTFIAPFAYAEYNQYLGGKFSNIEISDNTITNVGGDFGSGIQLAANGDNGGIFNAVIKGNNITGTNNNVTRGIRIIGNVHDTTITENTIAGLYRGVWQCYSYGQPGILGARGNTLHGNSITGCTWGVDNQYSTPENEIDASPNWWGSASGPYHASTNTTGLGNPVTDNVVYDPWWANSTKTTLGSNYTVANVTHPFYYPNIQAAIAAASPSDVLEIAPGTYTENLVINRAITLRASAAKDLPIIDGDGTGSVVTIAAEGVTLQGFQIQNSGSGAADAGVMLNGFDNCHIIGNTVLDNANGIILAQGNTNEVKQNIVTGNDFYGIALVAETGSTLELNNLSGNGLDAIAVENANKLGGPVSAGSTANVIKTNTISSNQDGIFLGVNCNSNIIGGSVAADGNTVTATRNGIHLWKGGTNTASYNVISGCEAAFRLIGSDGNTISHNTMNANATALKFVRSGSSGYLLCENNTVTGNAFGTNDIQVNGYQLDVAPNPLYDGPSTDFTDMTHLVALNIWPGGSFVVEPYFIYGSGAEVVYVAANDTLLHGNEIQNYQVKILDVDDLNGYAVQIKIPKVDFYEPDNFVMGSEFSMNIPPDPALVTDASTLTHWIKTISAARLDQTGADDPNLTLFSFDMTSKNVNNLTGSLIDLPLANVVLNGTGNPPAIINCLGTSGKLIIIDSDAPTMAVIPQASGQPLPTVIPPTNAVDPTYITISFGDNYNLDYIEYLIQARTDPATVPAAADFGTVVANPIDGILWNNTNAAWEIRNAELNALADGTYEIFFLAVDDAGNSYINPTPWVFIIDKTAPLAITWVKCLTTPDANNSVDLAWTGNGAKYDVWALNYSDLTGAGEYPLFNDADFLLPDLPAAPDPYNNADQLNWTQLDNNLLTPAYNHLPVDRGYYYYLVFAEDASGNIGPASEVRESISYWPGDVLVDNAVDASDISALSAVWGTDAAANPACNVGPTVDRTRRGRPIPDAIINIEDLMIFAMNYSNTDYTVYERTIPELNPIRIEMISQCVGDQLIVTLNLGDNNGFVKGLNIPILYGTGLSLLSVESGSVWPESSLLLHRNADNIVELSASTLGDEILENNGLIATLTFSISGTDSSLELQHMIARTPENTEIEIIDNPEDTPSGNEDPESVIPVTSYLGANYPNPFNPTTTIQFGLNQTENVRISIFNSRGQIVKTLVNGVMSAGTHNVVWNGIDNNNRSLGSGLYFYRMETKNYSETKKAILIK